MRRLGARLLQVRRLRHRRAVRVVWRELLALRWVPLRPFLVLDNPTLRPALRLCLPPRHLGLGFWRGDRFAQLSLLLGPSPLVRKRARFSTTDACLRDYRPSTLAASGALRLFLLLHLLRQWVWREALRWVPLRQI
jgi:hypothetical protein